MYKVILADDEPLIVAGLAKRINWSSLGFKIVAKCFDGQQVINEVADKNPDLIIIDIRMPKCNGLEVIKTISKNHKTKAIIISGYSDFEYARTALQLGAIDYILKPITRESLCNAVNNARYLLDSQNSLNSHRFIEYNTLKKICGEKSIGIKNIILNSLGLRGQYPNYVCVATYLDCESLNSHITYVDNSEFSIIQYSKSITVFVINYPMFGKSYTKLKNEALNYSGCLGISEQFNDITQIIQYIDESCITLGSTFFISNSKVGNYNRILHSNEHINIVLKNLNSALDNYDYLMIRNILVDIPRLFLDNNMSILHFEKLYNTLIFEANQIISNKKLNIDIEITYLNHLEIVGKFNIIKNATNYLIGLFNNLMTSIPNNAATQESGSDIILKMKDYIDHNFHVPLSLTELSEKYHIDISYLSKLFREEVGETFTKYITRIRIEHACYMLKNTSLSCKEVSELCGYADYSYFKKVFRKRVRLTPTEYRDSIMNVP